ncbi:hypothetical protein DQ04_07221040 [Trypanosoma grayi]|uniref:hypothetical protein n=1 Tax=Trypanosoma grayi TaxID=71804 RepID=UPI0004F4189B|nr:hypothetical protein DQ04_07221040 [Trypanosoma grayi]KEG08423.1 hypothetical protein DQ04_07221040 [Trypanosoma grayi]
MFVRRSTVSAFAILFLAIALLYQDTVWDALSTNTRRDSPCLCLTGIFADAHLLGALRRSSRPFIGIHWRVTPAFASDFMDPWRSKYANCLALHELQPLHVPEGMSAVDALHQQLEDDVARGKGEKEKAKSVDGDDWAIRGSGAFVSRRRRGRRKGSAAAPMCHVWLLPEASQLPPAVWVALEELLQEGTLAGRPVRTSGTSGALNPQQEGQQYYPLGVLLLADRDSLKRLMPPHTAMMFTAVGH